MPSQALLVNQNGHKGACDDHTELLRGVRDERYLSLRHLHLIGRQVVLRVQVVQEAHGNKCVNTGAGERIC